MSYKKNRIKIRLLVPKKFNLARLRFKYTIRRFKKFYIILQKFFIIHTLKTAGN